MATGMLEMIFPKKNLKYEFLNNLYFGPKFIFYGHLLGFLASFCFVVFCRWSTMVPNIFTQLSPPPAPPTMKMFPMALLIENSKNYGIKDLDFS